MDSFNTAFSAGSVALTWNAIMLALGILVAVVVSEIIVKKRGVYKDLALDACIVGIPAGLIGGRLFSAISGKIPFAAFFDLTQGGLNLPGALLFIGVGIAVYTRIRKLSLSETFDTLAPGAFFGLAVGRWSDFFLCDGLGPAVGESVPKFFPLATFTPRYFADGVTVAYAVFFLDFLICLALGVAALLIRDKKSGRASRVTIILYLFAEFILEWLRVEWPEDHVTREILFGEVRFNQIVLLAMLLFFMGLSLYRAKQAAKGAAGGPDAAPGEPEASADPQEETEKATDAPVETAADADNRPAEPSENGEGAAE